MISSRLCTSLVVACAIAAFLVPSSGSAVASSSSQAAVLRQEARWLVATLDGDHKAIASILSQNYKHVDGKGMLFDRAQELASITKAQVKMKWSQQTIDFAGDAAVVRGMNTMTELHKVSRERYTDVYVKQNGTWRALSAQETAIAP
jgi:Domain of unknown function (DUF4440)